ncbi:TetR/AcrR family transcriptional regulator [Microbacterium flavescens]|jgi:AcrR family transcriptional regulator|uniref:TetR/AcrR family transcriptional regulator n=1 Tax=Microbacterium flavescens TaxID=69366 RepID=UPI001BDF4CCE|nr:TetR/AcrR family transcriptional regulator [Microbacterium flavescens]BFF09237.1 TetR/AcrR family transcriptional regulator [Microbacterium flavescens]
MSEEPAAVADDDFAARARGPYAKGLARRQQILDQAIEVFARRGSAGTSLRSIAQEIGVSHAALTHYFSSREQLLVEVYREAERQKGEAEPHSADASPVDIMTESARRNHTVPGLVQLYSTLVAAALEPGHPDATAFAVERFSAVRADLVARVERGQAAGRIRKDVDAEAVASLVIAASDGLQTQWMLDESVTQSESLGLLARLLEPEPPSRSGEA